MTNPNDTLSEFQRVMIPMIRKVVPAMIATELTGVQPMSGPPFWPTQMEIGETYLNDADSYSNPGDPVEYYWAKPPLESIFTMKFNSTSGFNTGAGKLQEMIAWADETFGNDKNIWLRLNGKFCFTKEADRMLFVLRWK